MRWCWLILLFLITLPLSAQSLFEEAVSGQSRDARSAPRANYELNGSARGVFYMHKPSDQEALATQASYGEWALKLKAHQGERGNAYAEVRFRDGQTFQQRGLSLELREAYASAYVGPFDFRIGRQIIAWGRADGFNPTDNITPKDFLVRSPDEDDRRRGNFLMRATFYRSPFRIELIGVPRYASSILPTDAVPLSPDMQIGPPMLPTTRLTDGAYALRLNLELASVDGSLSYFNGYSPSLGIDLQPGADGTPLLTPRAYRMQVWGADFSTTAAFRIGLRGEFAYRRPQGEPEREFYIPRPDLQAVLGVDKTFGDLSILIQYIGRKVFDYEELSPPATPPEQQRYALMLKNRLISYQRDRLAHALSFRAAWSLLYETLQIECVGLVNLTTGESLFRPNATYALADALSLKVGAEIYSGAEDTLFGLVDSYLSAGYLELRASF